jgi:hypothetical protein
MLQSYVSTLKAQYPFLEHRFSQSFNRHLNITWGRTGVIRNGVPIQRC